MVCLVVPGLKVFACIDWHPIVNFWFGPTCNGWRGGGGKEKKDCVSVTQMSPLCQILPKMERRTKYKPFNKNKKTTQMIIKVIHARSTFYSMRYIDCLDCITSNGVCIVRQTKFRLLARLHPLVAHGFSWTPKEFSQTRFPTDCSNPTRFAERDWEREREREFSQLVSFSWKLWWFCVKVGCQPISLFSCNVSPVVVFAVVSLSLEFKHRVIWWNEFVWWAAMKGTRANPKKNMQARPNPLVSI